MRSRHLIHAATALTVSMGLISMVSAQTPPPTTPPAGVAPPAAVPPPPPVIAFDDALTQAATNLFKNAKLPDGNDRVTLVIDPLINGVTGSQSVATRAMEKRIIELARRDYPRLDVQPFNTTTIAKNPIVLIGTFTAINNLGVATGPKDAYRICLALADFKSKTIVSKGVARAKPEGINATPTPYFVDSPAWTKDPAVDAYIKSCQGTKVGDPIDAVYTDRILSAALLNDAINAYEAKRYQQSHELYQSALRTPGGDQLRAYNGLYLTNWKLNRRKEAADAFGKIVDHGLAANKLAVKFVFAKGSSQFGAAPSTMSQYPVWLAQIAQRTAQSTNCLELAGHASKTGPEPLNERLSQLRAQYVKDRLQRVAPAIEKRSIVTGIGSRENLIGTGRDDASDALDRRVEFKVIKCG